MESMKNILKDYENSDKRISVQMDVLPVIFRDEQIDLIVDCGFDTVSLNEFQFGMLGESVFEKVIEVLEEKKLNVKLLLWKFWRNKYGITRALEYDFKKHKNIVCISAFDEPIQSELSELKEIFDELEAKVPNDIFITSNLYPCYVAESTLGCGYEEHVDSYFKTVLAKQKTKKVVSCDYYPFMVKPNGEFYMMDTWAYNHILFAKYAKKYDCDLEWCIQSCNYDGHRVVDAQDIKMQMYMCIAFGVKGIDFFTYATPLLNPDFSNGGSGMIGSNFRPSTMYYAGKDAIKEFRKLEKFYMDFRWQGAKSFNGTNNGKERLRDFEMLSEETESFTCIDGVSCTENSIVSEFYDKEHDRYGYVVVNYNDPIEGKTDRIKFKLKNFDNCVIFLKGEPCEFGKEIEFELERGGGALVLIGK